MNFVTNAKQRRILFVGWPDITHNVRWMTLAEELGYECRLFALSGTRDELRGKDAGGVRIRNQFAYCYGQFRPNIIHSFGIDPAGFVVSDVLGTTSCPFSLQIRGGPEITLGRHDPWLLERILRTIAQADGVLTDNPSNENFVEHNGLSASAKKRSIGTVPGGGGLDFDKLRQQWKGNTSAREIRFVWPKAFLTSSVDGFSVAEGIRLAWEMAPGFNATLFFAIHEEFVLWLRHYWPKALFDSVTIHGFTAQENVLAALCSSRVMLSPSLIDGIPNILLEAAACGSIPIISSHENLPVSIQSSPSIIKANNLDPRDIAQKLVHSLHAHSCDSMSEDNFTFLKSYGDRNLVRSRVAGYYESLQ